MGRTKANTKDGLTGHIQSENNRTNDGKDSNSKAKRKKGETPNSSEPRPSKRSKTNKPSSNESSLPEEEDAPQSSSKNESSTKNSPAATPANVPPPYGNLTATHDVLPMHIISSTQIEKKVTSALNHLSSFPAVPPTVVMLHSKAKTASKMISIVEISKREIASNGGKWFQYNAIEQVIVPKKEPKGPEGKPDNDDDQSNEPKRSSSKDPGSDEDEDGEGFETMKTPFERAIEGVPKIRAVPTMTIYLSRVRIESLRKRYGYVLHIAWTLTSIANMHFFREQTNGLSLPL